jgi:hypothetical protein
MLVLDNDKVTSTGVTRIEVIDSEGRQFVNWNKDNKISVSLQDEGKTLKVFIDKT